MYYINLLISYFRHFNDINSFFLFLNKNFHKAENLFFFPGYNLGGAEKVHTQIIKNFSKEKNIVFFIYNSQDNFFLSDFKGYSKIFQLSNLEKNTPEKILYFKIFNYFIKNSRRKVNLFGCNNVLFYELVNNIERNKTYVIDLLHSFSFPDAGIEQVSIQFYDKIDKRIVINKKTKEDYISQYKNYNVSESYIDRIEVIENGVNIYPYFLRDYNKKLQILFSGRNSEEKRPNIFFEIAKILADYSFHIAGDNFENYPNYSNTKKHGKLTENKIEELYKENHILLITSYREGFPMVVMEAMSKGIVCICTDVGSIKDHVTDGVNGFIIENSENVLQIINNFVEKIKHLDEDRKLLEKISKNAYLHAKQNFDINIFNEKYIKLLNS